MTDDAEDQENQQPNIMILPDQMAGVWANFAAVSHSPYEFTVDFTRLDFMQTPPQGIVVARVSLSPLLVQQLIGALQENWTVWAAKAMPPEVYGSESQVDEERGGGSESPPAES